jgi:hypothetical protein
MNGKLNKTCTGSASANNRFYSPVDKFNNWLSKGSISLCRIVEVKNPYQVEKWIKLDDEQPKTRTTAKTETATATNTNNDILNGYTYAIDKDIDTRDNSDLWVLKINERLDREEYIKVSENLKTIKGYYSKFKHGFIFHYDPTSKLNGEQQEKKITDKFTLTFFLKAGYWYATLDGQQMLSVPAEDLDFRSLAYLCMGASSSVTMEMEVTGVRIDSEVADSLKTGTLEAELIKGADSLEL